MVTLSWLQRALASLTYLRSRESSDEFVAVLPVRDTSDRAFLCEPTVLPGPRFWVPFSCLWVSIPWHTATTSQHKQRESGDDSIESFATCSSDSLQ